MLQKQAISPSALLKDFHLSQTKIREGLLRVLMESKVALSAIEISRQMDIECDRVTLYRNLKTFVEKGIAHQIYVDNLESKYVLPDRSRQSGGHSSEHVHFKCVNCSVVQCLHDNLVAEVALPEGFKKLESNYVIFGLCKFCNHKD